MDYSRKHLADRLAAEYVLGTMRGGARRRFEALALAHPNLERARRDWAQRLAVLDTSVVPVPPPARVHEALTQRLFGVEPATPLTRWWQQLRLWQGLAGASLVAAITLAVLPLQRPESPPVVVVMAAQPVDQGSGLTPVSFVASVSGDGRNLVLKPLDAHQQAAVNKALELWAVPPQGAPRSLGLVAADRITTLRRTGFLQGTAAFAVSVEPPGGSPTGAPTGPIVAVGKLQL